jgi:hypothetical protein
LRNWHNQGKVNTERLNDNQKALRKSYVKLLTLCNQSQAVQAGKFFDLMYANPGGSDFNSDKQFAFMRYAGDELLLIVANFDDRDTDIRIFLPENVFFYFEIDEASVTSAEDLLSKEKMTAKIERNTCYSLHLKKHNARIVKFSLKK